MFTLANDGGLTYSEAMGMTNDKRRRWLDLMKERAEKQKEEADKARKGR